MVVGQTEMATRKIEGDSVPPPPSARSSSLRLISDNTAPISRRGGSVGTSLPSYPNAFVGRTAEIAALDRIVHTERARLVTIHGPGGMGKTRLVTAWAERVLESARTADVAYVPLAAMTNSDHVPNAIAAALGLTVDPKSDPFADILRALKNRDTIVVIDNVEHLIADPRVTAWLQSILSSCPNVRVVCTSRERLGMTAEHVVELHGLSNPDDAEQSDASELFSRRAKQLLTTFDEQANADSIVAICRLLEGVPLGIELAATWVRVLRCDEILVEIKKTLDFLTADPRSGRDPRQSSMRAVFSQSYTLLREDEQRVLARLSIFRGGFDRVAAEKIAGATLGLLAGLLDRSLVRARSTDRTTRYDMHELLRQFAAEKLAEEDRESVALAHAEYFVEWAQAIHPQLRGEGQINALSDLTLDLENVRSAIEFSLKRARYDLAARIGWALWPFWWIRNMQREGRLFMEALLPHADKLDLFWRTQATIALGAMVYAQGDVEACVRYSHELERLAGQQDDAPRPLAFAYGGFGLGATAKGDFKTAVEHLSKARKLFVEAGDPGIAAQAAAWMGTVHLLIGNLDLARSSAAAGLSEAIASGDRLANTSSRYCLARIALASGRLDEAVDHLLSSVPASIAIDDRGSLSFIFELLAVVAVKAGSFESAAILFGASDAVLEAIGHRGHTYYLPDTKGIAEARALAVAKLPADFQRAYEDGKRASIEALVAHVRGANFAAKTSNAVPSPSTSGDTSSAHQVRYFEEDDSIFLNQDYLIKGISGRILWRMLQIHQEEGRTEFTNRELRLDPTLKLPGYKDNLESRLLLLMKRLEEKKTWLRIERSGRGRLRMILDATPALSVTPRRD